MPNYQNSKIYKLINDEMPNKIYYGSTAQKYLCSRLATHKQDSKKRKNRSKELFEYGKVKIILVENYPCNNKLELLQREKFYIVNNKCINKSIPTRTQKEYYQDNKQEIIRKNLEYRKKNKKKI